MKCNHEEPNQSKYKLLFDTWSITSLIRAVVVLGLISIPFIVDCTVDCLIGCCHFQSESQASNPGSPPNFCYVLSVQESSQACEDDDVSSAGKRG